MSTKKLKLRHKITYNSGEQEDDGRLRMKLEFATQEKKLKTSEDRAALRTQEDKSVDNEGTDSPQSRQKDSPKEDAAQNARKRQLQRYERELIIKRGASKEYQPPVPLQNPADVHDMPREAYSGEENNFNPNGYIEDYNLVDLAETGLPLAKKGNFFPTENNALARWNGDRGLDAYADFPNSNRTKIAYEKRKIRSEQGKIENEKQIFRTESGVERLKTEDIGRGSAAQSALLTENDRKQVSRLGREDVSVNAALHKKEKARLEKSTYQKAKKIKTESEKSALIVKNKEDRSALQIETAAPLLDMRVREQEKLVFASDKVSDKDYQNAAQATAKKAGAARSTTAVGEKSEKKGTTGAAGRPNEARSRNERAKQEKGENSSFKGNPDNQKAKKSENAPIADSKALKEAKGRNQLFKTATQDVADSIISQQEKDSQELQDLRSTVDSIKSGNKLRHAAVNTAHLITTSKSKGLERSQGSEKLLTKGSEASRDKLYFAPRKDSKGKDAIKNKELIKKQNQAMQKQMIAQRYAKGYREAKLGNYEKAQEYSKAIAKKAVESLKRVFHAGKKYIVPIAAAVFLIIFVLLAFASCGMALSQGVAYILTTTYMASDLDITKASLIYSELETDLEIYIQNIETTYPGYDEYDIRAWFSRHNPYEFMAYLTVAHGDFSINGINGIENDIESLFDRQYSLSITPRTEMRTSEYTDDEGNKVTETYTVSILEVRLDKKSFEQIAQEDFSEEQVQDYKGYVESRGNRQFFSSPFEDIDWYYYVSSPFGWRINPTGEGKQLHQGVDIAQPEGTPILAVQRGQVITHGFSDSYGYRVVIENEYGWKSLYAHCSTLSVRLGETVEEGEEIGKVGSTGDSTGNHLHLEIMVDGEYLNPYYFVERPSNGNGGIDGEGGFLYSDGEVGYPVEPQYAGEIFSDYGLPNAGGRMHYGIDFSWGGCNNAPIYAMMDGIVSRSHYSDSFGWVVYLDHGNGISTIYAHQIKQPIVSTGQTVVKGQQIGNIGNTGNSTGPHLHLEYWVGDGLSSLANRKNPHILLDQVRN